MQGRLLAFDTNTVQVCTEKRDRRARLHNHFFLKGQGGEPRLTALVIARVDVIDFLAFDRTDDCPGLVVMRDRAFAWQQRVEVQRRGVTVVIQTIAKRCAALPWHRRGKFVEVEQVATLSQVFQQADDFHQGRTVYAALVDDANLLQKRLDNGGTVYATHDGIPLIRLTGCNGSNWSTGTGRGRWGHGAPNRPGHDAGTSGCVRCSGSGKYGLRCRARQSRRFQ